MNELAGYHQNMGALLAADGIPLHYGDLRSEYHAALDRAILLDRSHEGRILLEGESRFDLINRMSTNELLGMSLFEGRPTVFTNANARILFRAMCYNLPGGLLMISEPGQGQALPSSCGATSFWRQSRSSRSIADDSSIRHPWTKVRPDYGADRRRAAPVSGTPSPVKSRSIVELQRRRGAGPSSASTGSSFVPPRARQPYIDRFWISTNHLSCSLPARWPITCCAYAVADRRAWNYHPNTFPSKLAYGRGQLRKGLLHGQEIIARMESRQRLAKVMVKLELAQLVNAPARVYADGKECGRLTSSAASPDGEIFALAIIKTAGARPGTALESRRCRVPARVRDYAGAQPAFITD